MTLGTNWRRGNSGNSVVRDWPSGHIEDEGVDGFYGGDVVAESIPPELLPVVIAVPKMIHALQVAESAIRSGVNTEVATATIRDALQAAEVNT
jgi:hypothetical protein